MAKDEEINLEDFQIDIGEIEGVEGPRGPIDYEVGIDRIEITSESIPSIIRERQHSCDSSVYSNEEQSERQQSPTSRTQSIFHIFSVHKISDYNRDEQTRLINDYKIQLEENLKDLKTITNERSFVTTADTYYQYGLIYKKLGRVDDLLGNNHAESYSKREKAIKYFDKAIGKANKQDQFPNEMLAKYHSTKAKCLYNMNKLDEARNECNAALTYNSSDYTACEVNGYIYKAEKQYELALAAFKQSSGDNHNSIHYVVSLYNQSITLAALGKQEKAMFTFNLANNISLQHNLETEDRILAGEMHNPAYEELIRELASISSKQSMLNTPQHKSVKNIFDTINLDSSSPGKTIKFSQELSQIMESLNKKEEELKAEKTAHLDDRAKLEAALRRLESGDDISDLDKNTIKSDPDLHAFYTELKRHLNVTYQAAQSIETGLVDNNKTGNIGHAAKSINLLQEFIPLPKAFTIPAKVTVLALENIDKYHQGICIENFNKIADDESEMKELSKSIALKLTLQRQHQHELLEQSEPVKSHTNIRDIKKLAKSEAVNIAKFIEEMIFDGRINEDSIDTIEKKTNLIVALVGIDQNHHNKQLKELPENIKAIADFTLRTIKGLAEHWHENAPLEASFVERLADSIHKANIPHHIENQIKFATTIANLMFKDDKIIVHTHRTLKFWEHKFMLSENFLSDDNCFKGYLSDSCDTDTIVSVDLSGSGGYGHMVSLEGSIDGDDIGTLGDSP